MTTHAALRRTSLHDDHVRLGARMVGFGGYEMPLQYESILKEHGAVRSRAGLFDLSHMGQFVLRGEGVAEWADALTVNAVATMKPYQARYNIFCNDRGGAHDDVIFYRLPDRWLLVVNAANADKMWAHLQRHAADRSDVVLEDRRGRSALVAIQGPRAQEMLQPHTDVDLSSVRYYFCAEGRVAGAPAVVARTGYTGEDGFELFLDAEDASAVWHALLDAHADDGLMPCGLGARDVLRLEAGMPLYGHELTEEITPVQAGLTWAIKWNKPSFLGKEALARQFERGDYPRIVGLVVGSRAPAREGYRVLQHGRAVGEIRSGGPAPALGNRNIATALVEAQAATAGTQLEVEIRGTAYPAEVVPLPFYKRASS